jgi:hypothetical protein
MPILHLTYTNAAKTCLGKREPVEAIVHPQIAPHYASNDMFKVLPTIAAYKQYVHSQFSDDGGSNGIYGQPFNKVYSKYYVGGKGLTVSSALLDVVDIDLPSDPITHEYTYQLDKFAATAINSLPPPPTNTSSTDAWWKAHAPLFRKFFEKYGSSVIVNAKIGGMVEQASTYPGNTNSSTTQLLDAAMTVRVCVRMHRHADRHVL